MELLRMYRFNPYRKGQGPRFSLTTWATWRRDPYGKEILKYRLCMDGKPLFEGEDFACSPCYAIDSDKAAQSLMGFLTLQEGDVESSYFKDYTPEQIEYRDNHAEALAMEVMFRFGEED